MANYKLNVGDYIREYDQQGVNGNFSEGVVLELDKNYITYETKRTFWDGMEIKNIKRIVRTHIEIFEFFPERIIAFI